MLESLECIHGANEGLAPVCLRESAAAAALASARAALRLDPVAQAAKNAALRPSRQGEALLMRAVHVRLCANLLVTCYLYFFLRTVPRWRRADHRTSPLLALQRPAAAYVRFRTRSRHRLLSSAADGLYGAGRCHPG